MHASLTDSALNQILRRATLDLSCNIADVSIRDIHPDPYNVNTYIVTVGSRFGIRYYNVTKRIIITER